MYNLTKKQREILRWIVNNVRDDKLHEEFSYMNSMTGTIINHGGSKELTDIPLLTDGVMDALMASELIIYRDKSGVSTKCTLLGKAYDAVDTNFDEGVVLQIGPPSNSFFGLPKVKYIFDLFMLMPFSSELKPIYNDHIKKVAKVLNLSISRADDFFSQKIVMDEIWSAIVYATVIIADCTTKNPNVFYEIGLAHAIGKPVILITQNPDDVPFDLRHIRYINYIYTPPGMDKFEKDLTLTIEGTLKDLGLR